MRFPTDVLVWSVLLGGWTFMWLRWSFNADVRAWIVALTFPSSWRDGKPRLEISDMSPMALDKWLCGCNAPAKVCHLIMCRYCWSAHVAGAGTILLLLANVMPAIILPLVWACGAGIGNLIYDFAHRRSNQD